MIQWEAQLHQQVADYLKLQYRNVIYRTDFAAGVKMTMGQAIKHKRLQQNRAYPDLIVVMPKGDLYHALFLEIKHPNGGHQPYLKDGFTRSKDAHCLEQWAVLDELNSIGYYARMAVGFDQAKTIIDWYLGNSVSPEPTAENMATLSTTDPYIQTF